MPIQVASLVAVLDLAKDGFDKGVGEAEKSFGKLGPLAVGAGGAIAAGIGLGTAAIVGVGKAAFDVSSDIQAATGDMAASLGISTEAAEGYEDVMKGIFANNFGEDFEDIGASITTVEKAMDGLDDQALQAATEDAIALRDAFDKDVSESVDAADALMDQFGLTSEQAFDFVAAGLQKGLDSSGDFLDTIGEYSNQFGDAGFTADQFFSILESGNQNGVLGTDKIADAIKEMSIRLNEGGDAVNEAFGAAGLNFEQIQASVAAGDETWGDYFDSIVTGLQSIEDSIARQQAAIAIFGTQAEDLGPQFLSALDPAAVKLEDMAGSTETLNNQYNTMGDALEGLQRRGLVAIEPIGAALVDLANKAMPFLDEFLTRAMPIIERFAGNFQNTLGPALISVGDSLSRIGVVLGVATEGATGMDVALGLLEGTLNLIITAVQAVAVGFEKVAEAFEIAKGLGDQLGTINDLLGQKVGAAPGQGLFGAQGALNPFNSFAEGGIVPGQPGQPVPIIAHGGEEFLGVGQHRVAAPGSGGNSTSISITVGDVTATSSGSGNDSIEDALVMLMDMLRGKSYSSQRSCRMSGTFLINGTALNPKPRFAKWGHIITGNKMNGTQGQGAHRVLTLTSPPMRGGTANFNWQTFENTVLTSVTSPAPGLTLADNTYTTYSSGAVSKSIREINTNPGNYLDGVQMDIMVIV